MLANSMVPLAGGLGAASEDGELVLLVGDDRIKAVGERAYLYAMLHSHSVVEAPENAFVATVQSRAMWPFRTDCACEFFS